MKIIIRLLSLLLIASVGLFYTGCDKGGDDEDTVEKIQLGKLSTTWTMTSAKLNNEEKISSFTNPKLTISGTYTEGGVYQYTFSGNRPDPSPWPAAGTWKFGANPATDFILLDGNIPGTYSVSESSLTISYTISPTGGFPGGRTKAVSGPWVFVFSK